MDPQDVAWASQQDALPDDLLSGALHLNQGVGAVNSATWRPHEVTF